MDSNETITQVNYINNIIENNAKKLDLSEEEYDLQINNYVAIKEKINDAFGNIDSKISSNIDNFRNIFPNFASIRTNDIEYENCGGLYIRKHENYSDAICELLDAITLYLKTPIIHCKELNSLFITFYLYFKDRYYSNFFGFKLMNCTSGWRYNLWGCLTGNVGLSVILGMLTSGFVLFPILIYLPFLFKMQELAVIPTLLLIYKIARTLFDVIYYKLGFKNSIQKKITPFAFLYKYVIDNKVLQYSKLKELSSNVDDLPASISLLIENMKSENDMIDHDFYEFLSLYRPRKDY